MSNPWNLASMAEEKSLKKTFIIATLCSTLIGTFSSSIGLWDRVSEKRKQKHKDTKQDDEIRRLHDQVAKAEKRYTQREEELSKRPNDDELGQSLERSGAMIRREYDNGLERLGRRYAVGDTVTENQLQAQIIALQQTVINVLQEALVNERTLSRDDMDRLLLASRAAREGSLDALRQQYQRLAVSEPVPPRALPAPKRASTVELPASLYCRYSLDMQYMPRKPLSTSFSREGDGRCPECRVRLDIESSDTYWNIEKRAPIVVSDGRYEEEIMQNHQFHLGQRFIVKCHTADGEYACLLCNKYRNVDVLCSNVETLVNHVGRTHDVSELARDEDLQGRPPAQKALPAIEWRR